MSLPRGHAQAAVLLRLSSALTSGMLMSNWPCWSVYVDALVPASFCVALELEPLVPPPPSSALASATSMPSRPCWSAYPDALVPASFCVALELEPAALLLCPPSLGREH